jgi:hypothetical protein
VSRGTQEHKQRLSLFAYRTITFYDCPFQKHLTKEKFYHSVADLGICPLRLATPK